MCHLRQPCCAFPTAGPHNLSDLWLLLAGGIKSQLGVNLWLWQLLCGKDVSRAAGRVEVGSNPRCMAQLALNGMLEDASRRLDAMLLLVLLVGQEATCPS